MKNNNILPLLLVFGLSAQVGCQQKNDTNNPAKNIEIQNLAEGQKLKGTLTFAKPQTNYKDYLVGKTNFAKDSAFVLVPSKYCNKQTYLRKETYEAFLKMHQAAQKAGFNLLIVSGARNFQHQKNIWERKWKANANLTPKERAKKILLFSSMPMSSRHHWGTDVDLNSLNNSYFESGKGKQLYEWMQKNAGKFGFCQVFTDKKGGRTGYEMEKWHWSYMPLAKQLLKDYNKQITTKDFKGFLGSETADSVRIIKDYVNGINTCED
ncbi:D-alanyl-D-alanine carboxypeptidase family protein [Ornithobacterium rhinotracheale]|uniref:M15 family metallopeptidase n=1 Tax=Ornithobacterium rhinotracheale TaxID=28251 RepID=UPI00129CF260|nr:M15 family metallopeptidase [Ornithobacterium rhinotracheale]MRI63023.1 D-alanyl-D-alanine carboxypeptidase family protein [Ornithobacterium rhinotracheale]